MGRKPVFTEMFGMVLAVLFWSLSFVWYKQAYIHFKPFSVIFFRLVVSSSLLWIFVLISRKLNRVQKEHYKFIFLIAFFEPFLYFVGESIGIQWVSSTLAALLVSTIPIITPFFNRLFFNERIGRIHVSGMLVSFSGVMLLIISQNDGLQYNYKGLALMFLAVLSAVGHGLVVDRVTKLYNTFTIVTYQNTIGMVLFLPLFLIFDLKDVSFTGVNLQQLKPLLYLAILPSTVSYILFTQTIKVIGISKAILITNLIPVITAVASYFMLGEQFNALKIIGIFIVLNGLFISQMKPRNRLFLAYAYVRRVKRNKGTGNKPN